MGVIVTYDENFAAPYSEIKLASGEHILLSLERNRLVVKTLAGAERTAHILFECDDDDVSVICDGLIEAQGTPQAAPLRLLVAAVRHVPVTKALATILQAAIA